MSKSEGQTAIPVRSAGISYLFLREQKALWLQEKICCFSVETPRYLSVPYIPHPNAALPAQLNMSQTLYVKGAVRTTLNTQTEST